MNIERSIEVKFKSFFFIFHRLEIRKKEKEREREREKRKKCVHFMKLSILNNTRFFIIFAITV